MGKQLQALEIRCEFRVVDGGRLIEVLRGGEWLREVLGTVEQVNLITLQPGMTAGSHVHAEKREVLYIQEGELASLFRDEEDGETKAVILSKGMLVHSVPGVAHRFKNISAVPAVILEFSNRPYNPECPDTKRVEFSE